LALSNYFVSAKKPSTW